MSSAERQRRYLDRLRAGKPSVKPAKPDDAKDREIAALKAELEAERARRGASPARRLTRSHRREAGGIDFSETGKLRAEIGKLKSDIVKLKAMLQEDPDTAKLRKKVVEQQVEMASLRQAMKRIAKERDKYQGRQNPKYREAAKLLTKKNHGILIKALHSDRMKQCTAAELAEAERVTTALRPVFDEKN
jgi:hypothetical protein